MRFCVYCILMLSPSNVLSFTWQITVNLASNQRVKSAGLTQTHRVKGRHFGRCSVQPSAPSRVSSCSGRLLRAASDGSWKPLKVGTTELLWATFSTTLLHSCGNLFPFIKSEPALFQFMTSTCSPDSAISLKPPYGTGRGCCWDSQILPLLQAEQPCLPSLSSWNKCPPSWLSSAECFLGY